VRWTETGVSASFYPVIVRPRAYEYSHCCSGGIGSFIAADEDGSYIVLTLDDTRDIDLGDVLSGTFDGHGSLFYSVRNLTKSEDIRICLENWECALSAAIQSLLSMIRSPCGITAGSGRFISDADDVARKLFDEIRVS